MDEVSYFVLFFVYAIDAALLFAFYFNELIIVAGTLKSFLFSFYMLASHFYCIVFLAENFKKFTKGDKNG